MEIILLALGIIILAYLFVVIRQWRTTREIMLEEAPRPIVPVNLVDNDNAVIVAQGRGRLVYMNHHARAWFGLNGDEPHLNVLAKMVQPADTFRDLFAAEGRVAIRIGTRQVEANSYTIPGDGERRMVIVMRELKREKSTEKELDPAQAISLVGQISAMLAQSTHLEETLESILHYINDVIHFDNSEVNLWEGELKLLRPLARVGDPGYASAMERAGNAYHLDEGYSGWLARYRQALLVRDVHQREDIKPKLAEYPLGSFVGVPLMVGERFIGTLELASRQKEAFDFEDLNLLQSLSGQVAVAIENSRLYRDQSNRLAELSGLQQIAGAMAYLTEPSVMFRQLNDSLAHLMNVEIAGVMLLNPTEQSLVGQPPLHGLSDPILPLFKISVGPTSAGSRLWQQNEGWFTNVAFGDPLVEQLGLNTLVEVSRMRAIAFMPMLVGNMRIGAVLVANPRAHRGFSQDDMRSLNLFASEVAIVVENARLYKQEQRRAEELEGLQQIAQAIGVLREPKQLYAQITERIAHLLHVNSCGIWLYHESSETLIAQQPFYGIERAGLANLGLPLVEGRRAAQIWNSGEYWYSNHLIEDTRRDPDLRQAVEKMGIHKALFMLLRSGGQPLGVLQISDKQDGTDFSKADAQALSIFAGQAAVLIDNARLYAETRQQAVEAQGLRTIAETLARPADLDEIIGEVTAQVAKLLDCEGVALGLLDLAAGKLTYRPEHVYGRRTDQPLEFDIFSPAFIHSVALSGQIFITDKGAGDERMLPEYKAVAQELGLQTIMTVPVIIHDRTLGEITAFNKADVPFDEHDLSLLQTVAAQVAAAMERTRLYQSVDSNLQQRVEELDSISRFGRELLKSLDTEHILEVIRVELSRSIHTDGVTLVLFAPRSEWLSDNQPQIEKRLGGSKVLRMGMAPLETHVLETQQGAVVHDYAQSDLKALPPEARSAAAEPVVSQGEVIALLHLYSRTPHAFAPEAVDLLQRIAAQAALPLANARRYREQVRLNQLLEQRAQHLDQVYMLSQLTRQGVVLETVLDTLAKTLAESIGYRKVLIRITDGASSKLEPIAHFGLNNQELENAKRTAYTVADAKKLIRDRWRLGEDTYFLPTERGQVWFGEDESTPGSTDVDLMVSDTRVWHRGDTFVAPIRGEENAIMGWISVDLPLNKQRPTPIVAQTLELFAKEAAASIQTYRMLQGMREEAAHARLERDRLAMLQRVAGDLQLATDMPSRLQAIVDGIKSVGWGKVWLSMRDDDLENVLLVHTGYSEDEAARLQASMLSGKVWKQRFADPGFQALALGAAYYLRYDDVWVQRHVLRNQTPEPRSVELHRWHPQDIVYLPLHGQNQQIIGIIGMESPEDGLRPMEASLKPIELFAAQAAAAIENTRLYLESVRQQETDKRLTEMMESVAATLEMDSVLRTLADGLQQMIAFTRMHVALLNPSGDTFDLRRVEVTADQKVHIFSDQALPFEGSAMAKCYRDRVHLTYRIHSPEDAMGYADLERWYNEGERITMMVPMIAGGETMGVLRLGSEHENARGFDEYPDLVGRMANLSAVTINHSRLLNDLVASKAYNEAVVESIQQGIVVLDADHKITSINAFMKQRYHWSDEALGKGLYEVEPEFEVFLKHSIATAIEEGEPQHQFEIQDFDSQGNRMIRNFYTYPLRQGQEVIGVVLLVEDVTERAMLESNLAQRAEQLGALTRVSSQITSTLASDQVVSIVLEALESVMPYDGVTLWLREGEHLKVVAARGYRHPDAAHPSELVGLVVDIESSALFKEMASRQQVLNVGDTSANDPRFPYSEQRPYKNWLGAPLISQGEVIGVIALEKQEVHYYDTNHEQLLQAFANQAAVALRNAQLFEQTTQRAAALNAQTKRLELMNRVAVALAQSLDIENIFEITLRETALAMDISEAAAIKIDVEHDQARVIVEYPRGDEEPTQVFRVTGNPIIARLRETLMPVVVNVSQDPTGEQVKSWLRRDDVEVVLFVPLVVGGSMIGMMHFDVLEGVNYTFSRDRLEIAQTLASQAAIAVQNAGLFEQSVMRTHELETLFEASQATAVTLDLNEAMRRVVGQMINALRADFCSIGLWDDVENRLEIRAALSAWGDSLGQDDEPIVYDLREFPIREQALRQREVINLRLEEPELHESERAFMEQNGIKNHLLVPLVVNEYSIGMIDLEIREQNRTFEAGDVRLARTLASQSAIAIENARLQTETRAQIEELYVINDLSTAVSSKVNVDELFPMIRDQLPTLTDADVLYVGLYDDLTKEIHFPVAVHGDGTNFEMAPLQLGKDEFSWVINRKGPLLLAGAKAPEARVSFGIETLLPAAKCFLGVPIMAADEVLGVLAVLDNSNARAFGLNDQRILTTVAAQLGVAIQNARLFARTIQLAEELEQRVIERTSELDEERQRVQTLYDIAIEVAASLDVNRVLSQALEKVAQAIDADSAVILGIDEVSEKLYVQHAYGGIPVSKDRERTQLAPDQGLAGWVLKNRQGVVIPDVQKDPRWHVSSKRDLAQRAAVAALLEVGDDARGVMMFFSKQVNAFNEQHLKLVTAAASQLANSLNNAELYSLIRDQAERLGAILRQEQVESTKNTAILDSVADGVMYANEHGTIVLFNTAASRILNLAVEDVVNRSITEMTGLYGGSSGVWMDSMERWMSDPASYRHGDFVEEILELEDGRVVSVRLSPVSMGDQFLGTVSVFRDITKIVEVDRLKNEFVATVSHELRTPMTSIKGYADLLLLGAAGDISEAQQRFLETIKSNADRLTVLVNDLLEVSRIDQNRVPLRFTPIEVPDLMQAVASHLKGRIEDEKRPMKVVVKANGSLPPIHGDYDRVMQIMRNLVDNAFNYTPDNGRIILAAKNDTKNHSVILSVKDSGVGIPDEIKDRVFDRFFRGDEFDDRVLDTPGTGLGLAIVKSLVEMHNGEIWFESQVGKGTTFFVRIPVHEEHHTSPSRTE